MISNEMRDWLKLNSKVINDLARAGHRVPKLIIDAYAQYRRCGDDRWLANLDTNISTFKRWQQTIEGQAALEGLHKAKGRSEHRTPAPQRQTVTVERPATKGNRQTKSGRVIR